MKLFTKVMTVAVLGLALMGCSNKHKPVTEEVVLAEANKTVVLNNDQFDDGVVKEDIVVEATAKNKETEEEVKLVEVKIPAETEFTDEKGEALDTPPVIEIEAQETEEKIVKNDKVTATKNVVETNIEIKTKDGGAAIPSEPITTKVKLPEDAKVGDKVKVELPDGVEVDKNAKLLSPRLITITLKKTGYLTITIQPNVFKKSTVVKIVIEKEKYTPVTGGE